MSNEHAKDFTVAGHIYINADADVCFNRIHKRSRNGEENIPLDYLTNCSVYHDNMLDKHNEECVCLDQHILDGNVDIYENKNQIKNWINEIDNFIRK